MSEERTGVSRNEKKREEMRGFYVSQSPREGQATLVESAAIELESLSQAVGPTRTVNPGPADITDLAYDARRVTAGALFACVPGQRVDGHDFGAAAVERGAAALIVERQLELPVPQLVVADAREAMALAADAFFGRPTRELLVAGVTGTNGKTTTAFLLFSILAAAGMRPGLLGTVEGRVGGERRAVTRTTPEAIDLQRTFREMLDAGDRRWRLLRTLPSCGACSAFALPYLSLRISLRITSTFTGRWRGTSRPSAGSLSSLTRTDGTRQRP